MTQQYSGGVESVVIGDGLVGILYTSAGDRPRPTAVLLHGIPGSEKNVDLAYRLRDMGWHTLILSFGGAWGSAGAYDMTCHPADAQRALAFLRQPDMPWQVDPSRIVLIGYSLGSRAAIVAAKRDAHIAAVVSIAGIADFDELVLSREFFSTAKSFLHAVDERTLAAQWLRLGGDENPSAIIGQLGCPILIVHGTHDDVVPYYMGEALAQAQPAAQFTPIEGADHVFTYHRATLVQVVTTWLAQFA